MATIELDSSQIRTCPGVATDKEVSRVGEGERASEQVSFLWTLKAVIVLRIIACFVSPLT